MTDSLLEELTENFMRFPGIGPRQARRFVYYLMHAPPGVVERLLRQIEELRQNIVRCPDCYRIYTKTKSSSRPPVCEFCRDENRDASLLMLVAKDVDLETVLKTGTYQGGFFVLGGLVKILDQRPAESVRGRELLAVINKRARGGQLKEIIAALSANQEGDQTVEFLKKYLAPALVKHQLKFSTLGRGFSTGVEVEYSDAETLKNALKNREPKN